LEKTLSRAVAGVAVVGCGYVFDHYMSTWDRHPGLVLHGVYDRSRARVDAVTQAYGLHGYPSVEALLDDPDVEIVVNLTSIDSHHRVTHAALQAGKHVYTEKPVAASLEQTEELYATAAARGLSLVSAPSNALSPTLQSMWKAVREGAVGRPRLVYAEFDDNPIYLMRPENWRSRTGAPWPYRDEYQHGCTIEHGGYHLLWLCAIFGPVASVTAFSKQVVPDKTDEPLDPAETPDFSVAVLDFASGVVARLTFSIAAPLAHGMRIVGDRGMLTAETYRDYECPVYLERFTDLTLNARKARSVRSGRLLASLLGVGGRRIPLVAAPFGTSSRPVAGAGKQRRTPRQLLQRWKAKQTGVQDKCLGIAELATAIRDDREPFPPRDLTLHVTELLFKIQEAGTNGSAHRLRTDFAPVAPAPSTIEASVAYRPPLRTTLLDGALRRVLDRMHRH
jgi:predicted dehydrogenase